MRSDWLLIAVLGLSVAACEQTSADEDESGSAAGTGAGAAGASASGAGSDSAGRDSSKPGTDSGTDDAATTMHDPDASTEDAAVDDADASIEEAADAGSLGLGTGSCCTEHDTPGCSDANLQVCVCELLPSCCTEAWGLGCVLIVEQKYCQEGVRDCVCGTEEGQWEQTACCTVDWTDVFCDQVAGDKCGATPGCS